MKSNATNSRDRDSIATDWVMRLDRRALSEAERCELEAWLSEDTRHRGAFLRAQAVWSKVRHVAAQDAGRFASMQTPWLTFQRLRLAAALAVMMIAAGWGAVAGFGLLAGREVADLGEIRRFALDDGSMMVLNTTSAAQIRYNARERRIVMRYGEASFVVAKHDKRPFLVQARDVSVRAVGTMFTVRVRPAAVSVTVNEGVVEIARPASGKLPAERNRIGPNLRLTAPESQPAQTVALNHQAVSRQLAWQQGLLIFDGDPLRHATDEVNRYSSLKVVIDNPALLDKPFVGVFRTGDSRAFAYAIAALFNARVVEETEQGNLRIATQ